MLTVFDELYLLALHAEKGTLLASKAEHLPLGVAGGVLAELALRGKIVLTENRRLKAAETTPTEDELLDKALEEISKEEKERKIGYWLGFLSEKPDKLRKRLGERLVQAGVMSQEDERLVWVLPLVEHPEQNATAKQIIIEQLRLLVLAAAPADLPRITLLNLLKACNFTDLVFLRDERKIVNRRAQELLLGEALINPAAQVVEEITAAIEAQVEDE
jgi:hypothetical protein